MRCCTATASRVGQITTARLPRAPPICGSHPQAPLCPVRARSSASQATAPCATRADASDQPTPREIDTKTAWHRGTVGHRAQPGGPPGCGTPAPCELPAQPTPACLVRHEPHGTGSRRSTHGETGLAVVQGFFTVSCLVVHLRPALWRLLTVCLCIGLLMQLALVSLWVIFGLRC